MKVMAASAALMVFISLPALAGTFVKTYLNCTYTGNTDFVPSPGQAFGQASESDNGCYVGTNVGAQVRALVGTSWYYGSVIYGTDTAFSLVNTSGYIIDSQVKIRGHNADPDSWSTWSSYGG